MTLVINAAKVFEQPKSAGRIATRSRGKRQENKSPFPDLSVSAAVYGALEAIEGRWYRGGSTPAFSFDLTEAQSIGAPLPLPFAVSDRRVKELNNWITRRSFSGRLPIRLNSETHPVALDDNRLAAFRSVEKQGKSLFRGSSRISFHRSQYSMFSLISET